MPTSTTRPAATTSPQPANRDEHPETPWGEHLLQQCRINRVAPYVVPGVALLDAGCGDGSLLLALAPRLGRGEGVDQRVVPRTIGNVRLRLWRAGEPLPFGGEEFDVVTMTAVLEHLDNPGEVLTECYRVLRPGGRLLLTTPSPLAKPVLEFLAFRLGLISRREITDHKYYFSKRELRQLLGDIGFATPVVRYWQLGFNLFAVAEKPSLPSLL